MLRPLAGRAESRTARYGCTVRISARNQLPGRVAEVEHGAVMSTVTIRLDGGEEIVSVITRESAEKLELAAGDPVFAVIKSTEVMVAKEM